MQHSLMVHQGISHKSLECVLWLYTRAFRRVCVYQENSSGKWDTPWYSMKARCITILYHVIVHDIMTVNDS